MVMNEKSEGSKIWQVVAGLWLSWLGHTEVYLLLVEISFMGRGEGMIICSLQSGINLRGWAVVQLLGQ